MTAPELETRVESASVVSAVRREETLIRYGGIGDTWHMSWSADDRQFLSFVEGVGFAAEPTSWRLHGMLTIDGGPEQATFAEVDGYPVLAIPEYDPATDPYYYAYGTLAIDGYVYQFLSTYDRPHGRIEMDAEDPSVYIGVKVIYSPDNGVTWFNQDGSTPVRWEKYGERSSENMVFWEEDQTTFCMPAIVQMGKGYELNTDGYVYIASPNGQTEGTMNQLVLARVPKETLLDRDSYEFFAGRDATDEVRWSSDIGDRQPVHTFPSGWVNVLDHPYSWHPSIAYNAPLGTYMMVNWGTAVGPDPEREWFVKPSYFGIWVADSPWGPWRQIHEETEWTPGGDVAARAFQAQISPKWISDDGTSFWLVWSDFQVTDAAAMRDIVTSYANDRTWVDKAVHAMSHYRPYFSFNTQRIDLVVAPPSDAPR
jgi:hypothetical protein